MPKTAQTDKLLSLAKSRDPAERERLLRGIADLCDGAAAGGGTTSPAIQELLDSIFMSLVMQAERDIRTRLSERISEAAWAPAALVKMLAADEIDIARPIISASPVLKDQDLLRLLVEATIEHQIEVARRPKIGSAVVDAILAKGEPLVLAALAGNDSADLSEAAMERLVDFAKRVAGVRSPLARHPSLSAELAERLYQWVGQSLRAALAARFRLDPTKLDEAIARSIQDAHTGSATVAPVREEDRDIMDRILIEKLHAAGQLRPGYLVRTLKEGQLELFVLAIAVLGGFEPDHIQRAIDGERPELLALACAAVGIDRSVFPTVLELVRRLNGGRPGGGAEGARRAIGAFGPFHADIAGVAFRKAAARA